jgi:nitronate monooxygenase
MGAGVSDWRLARAVSRMGHLGVVSGTALDSILARRLQDGDPGGHMRRGLSRFPVAAIAERILNKYYRSTPRSPQKPYIPVPLFTPEPSLDLLELAVAANFVEINLAKEGHHHPVGINLMEKIQMPLPSALYGAMLAGVDYVLVGAGIPRAIPGVMDRLTTHLDISMTANVDGSRPEDDFKLRFDPRQVMENNLPVLKRPKFLAIVASNVLAITLARKASGRVDGFIIEGPTAGGHNAPPRGGIVLDDNQEPIYGPKDEVDLIGIQKLGLPFWLAGSYGSPEKLKEALSHGAAGIQVGSVFAFCRESGLAENLKKQTLASAAAGTLSVFTDALCSPTGFPFKVVALAGSLSDKAVYEARKRVCNLAYLRSLYRRADGTLGYRCAAEPVEQYLKHDGKAEDAVGRKCLCNSLLANIALSQVSASGYVEPALVTAGNDTVFIHRLLEPGKKTYTAGYVLRYLTGTLRPRPSNA